MKKTAWLFYGLVDHLAFFNALLKKHVSVIIPIRKRKRCHNNLIDTHFFNDLYEEIW